VHDDGGGRRLRERRRHAMAGHHDGSGGGDAPRRPRMRLRPTRGASVRLMSVRNCRFCIALRRRGEPPASDFQNSENENGGSRRELGPKVARRVVGVSFSVAGARDFEESGGQPPELNPFGKLFLEVDPPSQEAIYRIFSWNCCIF
jgi:hypothetical protein